MATREPGSKILGMERYVRRETEEGRELKANGATGTFYISVLPSEVHPCVHEGPSTTTNSPFLPSFMNF